MVNEHGNKATKKSINASPHAYLTYKCFNFQKFPETFLAISGNCLHEFPGNILIPATLWRGFISQKYRKRAMYNETHLFWFWKKVFESLELELLAKKQLILKNSYILEKQLNKKGFRLQENGYVSHHFPCKAWRMSSRIFTSQLHYLCHFFPGNGFPQLLETFLEISGNIKFISIIYWSC